MAEPVDPIFCPRCNQPLYVRAYPGQLLNCRNCRSTFPAPPSATAPSTNPPVAPEQRIPRPPQRPVSAGAPPAHYTPPAYRGVNRLSRMALWSLIFGILFFFPPTALLAVIFGIIGIAKTSRRNIRGRGLAVAGLVLGCLGMAFAAWFIPMAYQRGFETAHRVRCASNLRQIGQAMLLYANENRGQFPPTMDELLLTQDITSVVFVCPSTDDTPATGMNTQQTVANVSAGGHQSYVYLGKGKNGAAGANVVLVYEPLSHHKDGFNALFGDGRVVFIYGPDAAKIEAELKAGQDPPPSYKPQLN